jgi:hypothetical protein
LLGLQALRKLQQHLHLPVHHHSLKVLIGFASQNSLLQAEQKLLQAELMPPMNLQTKKNLQALQPLVLLRQAYLLQKPPPPLFLP